MSVELIDRIHSDPRSASGEKVMLSHTCNCEARAVPLVLVGVILVAASACGPRSTPTLTLPFEKLIGATVDPDIALETNQDEYDSLGPDVSQVGIAYWVTSPDATPLYFQDESLGLSVYQFDSRTQNWVCVLSEVNMLDPRLVRLVPKPYGWSEVTGALMPFQVPTTGKVRLVVVGWKDPSNPEGSKFAAYKDIELVPK